MSLLADYNLPFAAALVLMALIALVQAVGLGGFELDAEADVGADLDAQTGGSGSDAGVSGGIASLLGLGRVPLMIWLASFLLLFAASGLAIQALAESLTGAPLGPWLAAAFAAAASLPLTSGLVRPLARILPRDTTTAVGLDSLVGRRATITIGRAAARSPARAQVADHHGHLHHVMVEPHDGAAIIGEGEKVLLVRREQGIFYAIPIEDARLAAG